MLPRGAARPRPAGAPDDARGRAAQRGARATRPGSSTGCSAEEMGVPWSRSPTEILVDDDAVHLLREGRRRRVDVLYLRIDEEALLHAAGRRRPPARRRPLLAAVDAGRVALANAPGNGVADDKAVYALRAAARSSTTSASSRCWTTVPTYLCGDPDQRRDGAGAARRARPQAGRRVRRRGRPHRPARDRRASWRRRAAQMLAAPAPLDRPGDRRAVHPPGLRRRARSSRATSTCGRSSSSASEPRGGSPRRADPGRARGQHDRELLARRRVQGHLAAWRSRDARADAGPMCGLAR